MSFDQMSVIFRLTLLNSPLTQEGVPNGQHQMSILIYSNLDWLNEKQMCFLLFDEKNESELP